jgi:hypothetical protein
MWCACRAVVTGSGLVQIAEIGAAADDSEPMASHQARRAPRARLIGGTIFKVAMGEHRPSVLARPLRTARIFPVRQSAGPARPILPWSCLPDED